MKLTIFIHAYITAFIDFEFILGGSEETGFPKARDGSLCVLSEVL